MKIAPDLTKLIGNTPLVKVNKLNMANPGVIYAKLESFNPLGCVKERVALAMIEAAEQENKIKAGGLIIEPTSGNTGIGLALVAAIKGYRLILTMPDTMSLERRKLLKALGAELILTAGSEGMKGAIKKAEELHKKHKDSFMPQQFDNPANPDVHKRTTAVEIWEDSGGKVDIFVAGVGTGGTITGVGEELKKRKPSVQIFAVEPAGSAVISGENPGPHKIQGIGAGFIPKILNVNIIDEVVKIEDEAAVETARQLALTEGIFAGISSGAAMKAALMIAERKENRGKNIVVLLPDTGERYLSTWLYED